MKITSASQSTVEDEIVLFWAKVSWVLEELLSMLCGELKVKVSEIGALRDAVIYVSDVSGLLGWR